ncbi:PIG-L deacetylase family protein [Paenibacillus polymyxa]|uniref:PIG-L deacetylase family protein n=1 Tax=Paenibacillus polymyxa TaxID=1406 RepID=UPI0006760136|nr:PIG-L deacetylase family protein [Paenibacillus polymyxa]RPE06721.1 GlcNAc-PI de-N-acetylase [Paenibacillus polymyxa]
MKRILIFTAHPDDAEISMGGTIMKLINKGCIIKNIIVSIPNNVDIRIQETKLSSEFMKIEYEFFDTNFPCGVEDISKYELVNKFDNYIEEFKPDAIFTHWEKDSHQDHRILSDVVKSCFRKFKCDFYYFEQTNQSNIIKSNEFTPNIYVDITDYLENKIKALSMHKSQLKGYMAHYLDDLIKLAEWRGHQINTKYAETFKLVNKQEII